MDNEQSEVVLVRDDAGATYALRRTEIAHGRIPAEMKSQVEELLSGDVEGYGNPYWMLKGILSL